MEKQNLKEEKRKGNCRVLFFVLASTILTMALVAIVVRIGVVSIFEKQEIESARAIALRDSTIQVLQGQHVDDSIRIASLRDDSVVLQNAYGMAVHELCAREDKISSLQTQLNVSKKETKELEAKNAEMQTSLSFKSDSRKGNLSFIKETAEQLISARKNGKASDSLSVELLKKSKGFVDEINYRTDMLQEVSLHSRKVRRWLIVHESEKWYYHPKDTSLYKEIPRVELQISAWRMPWELLSKKEKEDAW